MRLKRENEWENDIGVNERENKRIIFKWMRKGMRLKRENKWENDIGVNETGNGIRKRDWEGEWYWSDWKREWDWKERISERMIMEWVREGMILKREND